MGLVQVATTSVSNVSNFSITGITTDDVYLITLNDLYMTTDGARPRLRFTKSSDSSADTTFNYALGRIDMYTNQAFYKSGGQNLSYYNGFSTGTDNTEGLRAIYYCYNFNSSSEYSFITFEEFATNNASENAGRIGGMVLKVQQSTNGFNWHSSTGNISNATATLYRVV
jgi:hypothetical protein